MEINGYQVGPGANLYGADLSNANLEGLDLSGAVLSGANLGGANCRGTNFAGADLSEAYFSLIVIEPELRITPGDFSGASFVGAMLFGGNLDWGQFSNADFTRSDLSGANMDRGQFNGANFTDAMLYRAIMHRAALAGANFTRADLSEANVTGTDLSSANLTDAITDGMFRLDAPRREESTSPESDDQIFLHELRHLMVSEGAYAMEQLGDVRDPGALLREMGDGANPAL